MDQLFWLADLEEGGAALVQADQLLALHEVRHVTVIIHAAHTEPENIYTPVKISYPTTISHLVPARSLLSLLMTAARACLLPTYTVRISTLPNMTRSSHAPGSTPARM